MTFKQVTFVKQDVFETCVKEMILATFDGKSAIKIPNTADHAAASAMPPMALKSQYTI